MKTSGSVIVSLDFSNGKDSTSIIVGELKNGKINIVNVFQGKETEDIYNKLTRRK